MKRLILVLGLVLGLVGISTAGAIPTPPPPAPTIVFDNGPTCDPVYQGSPCFGPPNTGYHAGDSASLLVTVQQDDQQTPGTIKITWPAGALTFVSNGDGSAACVATSSSVTCTYTDFAHLYKSDTFNFTVGNNPPSYVVNAMITATTIDGTSAPADATLQMADVLSVGAGALTLSQGIEGLVPVNATFTFNDTNTSAPPSNFTATIDWGDGSPPTTGALVVANGGGVFSVLGSHLYAEEGQYTVKVTVVDLSDNTVIGSGTATVVDAALTASCGAPATSLQAFTGSTASFIDGNAGAPLGDFTATIDWGDGTTTSGTVSGSNGHFSVAGHHTYGSTGPVTIKTSIIDEGGSHASTSCSVLVYAFAPGGGAFAIGDRNSILTHPVTFWSDTWKASNKLSGGSPVPDAFKGFAKSPAVPTCGVGWTTPVGPNAAPPPAGPLPAYMGVWVTSSITKSGKVATGYTFGIDIVKTDPGYANDLMHTGTGTVVAHVCSSQF